MEREPAASLSGSKNFLIPFFEHFVNFYYSWDQTTYENLRLKIVSILFAMQSGLGGLQLHYRGWKKTLKKLEREAAERENDG